VKRKHEHHVLDGSIDIVFLPALAPITIYRNLVAHVAPVIDIDGQQLAPWRDLGFKLQSIRHLRNCRTHDSKALRTRPVRGIDHELAVVCIH